MSYLVLGNWKSYGTWAMVEAFKQSFNAPANEVKVGLALPFHLLRPEGLPAMMLGAQNVSAYGEGAYTGEITTAMLKEAGCAFALVGHSERRQLFGESVASTAAKVSRLLEAGLLPVFCCGETLEERRAGLLQSVLRDQLAPFAEIDGKASFAVAYEPVWAIGTGVAATIEEAAEAHKLVKRLLAGHGHHAVPVLYGGSVKPENALDLGAVAEIDGFLVGGASLDGQKFSGILDGFSKAKHI